MSRWIPLFAMFCVFLSQPAIAQDKPPVKITWHGHSFFTVKSSQGTVVAIDPHLITAYGRLMGVNADIILTTHNHNDHTQVSAIDNWQDKKTRIITGLKGASIKANWANVDETIKDVNIRSIGTFHDDSEGMQRGKNSVFVIEVDGWRIAHLGDLGHLLTPAQVKKIGPIDVLMIPVGGIYTLNGAEAKKVVEQLQPKEYIFPMHYGHKVFEDLLPITEFLEDQDRAKIAATRDNNVLLNRDPTRPRPLIVQLHYWPMGKQPE